MSLYEKIMDPNDFGPITMYTADNQEIKMEQIAVVELGSTVYLLAKPLDVPELAEDEGLVFELRVENGEELLALVEDYAIIDAVFDQYYILLEDAGTDTSE